MGRPRSAHRSRHHSRDAEVWRRRGRHGEPRTKSGRSSPPHGDAAAAVRRLHVGPTARPGRRLMLARHALSNATLLAVALLTPPSASSQNLAITNARIIVGSGQVIDSGTLIVRDGKI